MYKVEVTLTIAFILGGFMSCCSNASVHFPDAYNIDIPQDSVFRKIVTAIPIIGAISYLYNVSTVNKLYKTAGENFRVSEILNDYNIAFIVSVVVHTAIFGTLLALNIIGGGIPLGVFLGVVGVAAIAKKGYEIYQNIEYQKAHMPASYEVLG